MSSIFDQPFDETGVRYASSADGVSLASLWRSVADAPEPKPEGAVMPATGGEGEGFRPYVRLAKAAYEATVATDLSTSRSILQERGFDKVIEAVQNTSGVKLENPVRGGYWHEAGADDGQVLPDDVRMQRQVGVFDSKIAELVAQDPKVGAAVAQARQDFSPEAQAHRAESELAAASADTGSVAASMVAQLAGGIPATLRDPLTIAGLAMGGGEVRAATAIARIGATALRETASNAAFAAVQQGIAQQNRGELGLEASIGDALRNVAFGAAIGGGFGGLLGAGRELARALPPTEAGVVAHALAADAADGIAVSGAPEALRTPEGRKAMADAVAYAEDPYRNPPPELVPALPPARADRLRVTNEDLAAGLGQVETVDGKPVTFGRFNPRAIGTDAAAFQYKGGGDAAGVTDRLQSVTRWDPLASGKALVFEREDGSRVIADGHQRLGLARRLSDSQDVALDGFLFREADGWTPEDVRALAAKKNIQEGSGDAIDAARVLRDRPDLADGALPKGSPMVRQALALSRLSDDAWGMVVNGAVPPSYGAAVAATVVDPLQHAAVIDLLARAQPETERQARLLIGEALEAGFTPEHQIDLFGAAETTRSLMAERVSVLDAALVALRKDRRLFGTLAKSADAIEDAGNVLARGENDVRAATAARLEDILTRIARRSGPVSDQLNTLAERLAAGEAKGKLAREFLDGTQRIVDERGLVGLLANPELRPARAVEPGSPEAVAAAGGGDRSFTGQAANDRQRPPQAGETPVPVKPTTVAEFRTGQAGLSVDALHARASAFQPELAAAGREIAEATGAQFRDPGVKSLETARAKIARKGYDDASSLTDLARGGFAVTTPEAADRVVAELGRRFDIVDEGWATSLLGYQDRKVLVRAPDGVVAEVQIAAEHMWATKKGGGQALYKAWREAPAGEAAEALRTRSLEAHAAAKAGADPAWKSVGGISSEPNSGSNVARQTGSAITAPVEATSWKSTGDQSASGLSLANALPSNVEQTAGRQSQLMKSGIEPSETNMAAAGRDGNAPGATSAGQGEPSLFDALPLGSREDGADARLMTRDQALAEADRLADHADLTKACKS